MFFSFLAGFLLPIPTVSAHSIDTSRLQIIVEEEGVSGFVGFNLDDLIRVFGDLSAEDMVLTEAEAQALVPYIEMLLQTHVSVSVADKPITIEQVELDDRFLSPLERDRGIDVSFPDILAHRDVVFFFETDFKTLPETIHIAADFSSVFGQQHTTLAGVLFGDEAHTAVFDDGNGHLNWSRGEGADAQAGHHETASGFFTLGVEHIFIGYDHILFLLALILWGGRLWSLIKIVTAFTIAHSITLALAALEIVMLPGRLIECAIAASIIYVAAENFFIRKSDHRWVLTFAFGLIHGFGFANVLAELQLPQQALAQALVLFNVGVEAGQIAIVAILFPVILWLSKRECYPRIVYACSSVILLFGAGWLVERVFGLAFMPI